MSLFLYLKRKPLNTYNFNYNIKILKILKIVEINYNIFFIFIYQRILMLILNIKTYSIKTWKTIFFIFFYLFRETESTNF